MQTGKNSKAAASEAVVITGFGLVTPIGQSFWHSMLSLRAKRSCYQQHETVLVAASRYGEILRGAAISRVASRIIPRSLSGADRTTALLLPSIAECLDGLPLELRQSMGWQLITRHADTEGPFRASIAEKLPEANSLTDSFCPSGAVRSQFFARIADAAESLLASRADRVLVACADSLCDTPQLEELLYDGQLKDAANAEDSLWEKFKQLFAGLQGTTPAQQRSGKSLVFSNVKGVGNPLIPVVIDAIESIANGSLLSTPDWLANRGGYRDRVDANGQPGEEGELQLVTMQLPDGAGDGTVPESSARALKLGDDTQRTFCIGDKLEFEASFVDEKAKRLRPQCKVDFDEGFFDRTHEPICNTKSAQFITFAAIENICRREIRRKLEKEE